MNASQILVVDADEQAAALLCRRLAREGFAAQAASSRGSLQQLLDARRFALVVLDLDLPAVDALALAREGRLRAEAGLITVSREAGALDRVLALEMGADDSMSKPLHPQELVARIRAVLRRTHRTRSPAVSPARTTCFDGWKLRRPTRLLLSPAGEPVPLSDAEYRLLTVFLATPGEVVGREQLRRRVGGGEARATGRSIDLLVSRLRRKLGAADGGETGLIRTVRGAGYRFEVDSLTD